MGPATDFVGVQAARQAGLDVAAGPRPRPLSGHCWSSGKRVKDAAMQRGDGGEKQQRREETNKGGREGDTSSHPTAVHYVCSVAVC